jgi:hypothetical protein
MIPAGQAPLREKMMLLFAFALLALIAGTTLRKVGVEAARANAHGSAAALAGRRKSGIGNWLTGARYNEIASITWDKVDTLNWVWVGIYRSKVDNTGTLAMTPRLRAMLQRRWAERRNTPFIFAGYGEDEGPRGKSTKAIRKAIERAKLNPEAIAKKFGKVTVHTFRDTFATRLRRAGVGLDELKTLLGHSDIRQTMKYATIDAEGVALKAAETLGAIRADQDARQFVPSKPSETVVTSPEVRGKTVTHSEEGNANVASTFDVTFWNSLGKMVGAAGFEPTTSRPPV